MLRPAMAKVSSSCRQSSGHALSDLMLLLGQCRSIEALCCSFAGPLLPRLQNSIDLLVRTCD